MRYIPIYLILLLSLPSMAIDMVTDYYKQVTSNEEIIEGREYIIVHKQNDNFFLIMGIYSSGNNIARVELHTDSLVNEKVPYSSNMGKYTLEKKENVEAWYIKDQQNRYLTYRKEAGNYVKASEIATTFSRFSIKIEDNGEATINYLSSTGNPFTLQYNNKTFFLAARDKGFGKVFLYYKDKTMYARTAINAGNYGTVCIPYAVNDVSATNAEFYEIKGKTTSSDKVSSIIITPVNALAAGTPYIFRCEQPTLEMPYTGERVAEPQPSTGMVGTFVPVPKVPAGNYLLSSNQIRKITEGSSAGIREYRAYLTIDDVPELTGPLPAKAKTLGNSDNTTDIHIISSSTTPSHNTYNLQGQRVAPGTSGIVIINGKKRINR